MQRIFGLSILLLSVLFLNSCNAKTTEQGKVDNKDKEKVSVVEHLTAEKFREKVWDYEGNKDWKYKGDLPCVIDFYAVWCGPCKRVAPIMEELAKEYNGKVKIYKINTDKQKKLARIFGITSIPSVLFCPKQGEPFMKLGALPKDQYKELIEKHVIDK